MSTEDALGLFQSLRPQSPARSDGIQAARSVGSPVTPDLHSLAMVPGTPGYTSRIPRPPCYRCGEDHVAGHEYGHPWESEPVHDEPVSATAIIARPTSGVQGPEVQHSPSVPVTAARRVTLYVGRGDTYVLAVEEPPDWDANQTFKVDPPLVLPLVRMARALDVKVMDKTGGDLLMLEQEDDDARRQLETNHARGAEGAGDRRARRQGQLADGQEEHQPEPGQAEAG